MKELETRGQALGTERDELNKELVQQKEEAIALRHTFEETTEHLRQAQSGNKDLQVKLSELEEAVLKKELESQQIRKAEAEQRMLAEERNGQILRLTETLKQVAQEKAILSLLKTIASANVEQLRAITQAESRQEILDAGLNKEDVDALQDEAAFRKIINAAQQRLLVLEPPRIVEEPHHEEVLPVVKAEDPLVVNEHRLPEELPAVDHEDASLEIDQEKVRRERDLALQTKVHDKIKNLDDIELLDELSNASTPEEIVDALNRIGVQREDAEKLARNNHFTKMLRSTAKNKLDGHYVAFNALEEFISKNKDYELLDLLTLAHSKKDLFKKTEFGKLNPTHVRALIDASPEIRVLVQKANHRIAQLDAVRNNEKRVILDGVTRWQALERYNRERLKGPMEKIKPLKEIREELKFLSQTPMAGLNPAFQASAAQFATDLDAHFQQLADGCDVVVPYLYKQRCEIIEFLGGLPPDDELEGKIYKDEVIYYRSVLERYLTNIEQELRFHMPMQELLNGTGNKDNFITHHGLLGIVNQAKGEQKDIRQLSLLYKVAHTDYLLTDKSYYLEHIVTDPSIKPGRQSSIEIYEDENTRPYQTTDRVKPAHFREHSVSVNNKTVGRFIEERIPDSKDSVKAHVKMKVVAFPDDGNTDARVIYAMAMATQFLAGLKQPPSAKNPIILRGAKAEQLEYLWTALMLIGDTSPNMRFGPESIKIATSHFSADKEMGHGANKFSSGSCYKKNFETHSQLGQLLSDVNKLTSDKFDYQKVHQKVQAHSKHAASLFKEGSMKEALKEMKQENLKEDDGPKFR